MTRNSCFMLSRVPSTLVSKVAAELSAVWSVTGPGWPSVPAALTAASIRPKRATIWSIRLLTSSARRTSARMKAASAPRLRSSASSALPSASRRPDATTDAPFLAKAVAVARPMPVNAPVINTTGVLIVYPPHWFGHVGRMFQGSRSLDLDVLPEADPVIGQFRFCRGLNRASAADAAITDKRNRFALPFKKRVVESVLEDRRRTVIVLRDRCDKGVELADTLAPSFRFRLSVNAARGHRRRRLIKERQPIVTQVEHRKPQVGPR